MPKLHLKRTPEEAALHELRKKEKREGKRRRRDRGSYHDLESESAHARKHSRASELGQEPERKWASSDEDEEQYGPKPASSSNSYASGSHKPDRDQLEAEKDDLRFKERLFDAYADDERLDSLEARMNDFAHVPDRWRTARKPINVFENDEWLRMDPQVMDEEEYAEWIRMGMYRKTHANEYAEAQRQKAAKAARRAEEKARREETARLEKAAEEERQTKKRERSRRQWAEARDGYQARWQVLLSRSGADMLEFCDIPWPIFHMAKHRSAVSMDNLTEEAITAFLLPVDVGESERSRKEVLREAFLRFHPDKFEGRIMRLVRESEREAVRQGISRVVVVLNKLMAE
ncbi:hypothetical protein Agabi119p4_2073 [Agaricus bisporus var. burnettii]|uniref:J domain-containing protein n=1 Tax=Agaricus bisporus var. burnettii TaxID=192524 RepID=A0A8H7F8I9_AGABI|nr:hypothetical protein Agabi119p4_2073 [Agaricus bisporus var. burnettii]